MARWPGAPSQPRKVCYTEEETEAGAHSAASVPRPPKAQPPFINLPLSSGNGPVSSRTTPPVTCSRC